MSSDDLTANGFFIDPGFLAPEELRRLSMDFSELYEHGRFRPAAVGRSASLQLTPEVRQDQIYWLEPDALTPAQALLWSKLEALRSDLNKLCFLGLWDLEAHYAHYPAGGFYRRHLDRFQSDDKRTVSVVIYLNHDWRAEHGGELVLYPSAGRVETVEPVAGKLVCFLSESIEHEVRESHAPRRSVAAWFRRRPT